MFHKPVKGLIKVSACAVLALTAFAIQPASAQEDQYVGELMYGGFNFAPTDWALCDGQLLAISSNTALFSLLGTNYGGNGTSNFALPNMQSRVPIGQGQGPGLSPYYVGQIGGNPTVSVLVSNMPSHTHSVSISGAQISASSATAGSAVPAGHALANTGRNLAYNAAAPDVTLAAATVTGSTGLTGGGVPVSTMPPYLTVSCNIALTGIFPPRN